MSSVAYYNCKKDDKQQLHSFMDPEGPCPYCTIATQAAAIEALESKLDYPHEEIAELEEHSVTMKVKYDALHTGNEKE